MLHEDFLTRHKQSDEGSVAVGGGDEPVDFDDTLQFCYTLIPPPPIHICWRECVVVGGAA